MKLLLLLLTVTVLSGQLNAGGRYRVYKRNGEVIVCDQVLPGMKTTCKTEGEDKINIRQEDLKYYTFDDTNKYIVGDHGYRYTVEIENDSVYLCSLAKEYDGVDFTDYYIYDKSDNTKIQEILKNKRAIETLKEYFGGACAVFDAKITAVSSHFTSMKFNDKEWVELLFLYRHSCEELIYHDKE